jgi:hypothetical protein
MFIAFLVFLLRQKTLRLNDLEFNGFKTQNQNTQKKLFEGQPKKNVYCIFGISAKTKNFAIK